MLSLIILRLNAVKLKKMLRSALSMTAMASLLLLAGCRTKTYVQHPGSLSLVDSQAYDALLVAQSTIDQAKKALAAGALPASSKPVLNLTVDNYNTALSAWFTYRDAIAGGRSGSVQDLETKLNADIFALTDAIKTLKMAIKKK